MTKLRNVGIKEAAVGQARRAVLSNDKLRAQFEEFPTARLRKILKSANSHPQSRRMAYALLVERQRES